MTTSGGFYKYRCKYFYTHNCQSWVWVNNSPCATCLAEGRDLEQSMSAALMVARDVVVPLVRNGVLQYAVMEFVGPTELGDEWTLRDGSSNPPPALAAADEHPFAYEIPTIDPWLSKSPGELEIANKPQTLRFDLQKP